MANLFGIIADGTYRVENIGYSTPELTSGYIVATRPIQREADLPTTGELFGRWTDYHDGESDDNEHRDPTVYWDAVEVIDDFTTAISTAYLRGEIAIWSIAGKQEHRVADWYPTEATA